MTFPALFFSSFFGLYVLVLLLRRRPRRTRPQPAPLPRVSGLVAARNEAARIGRCLRALARLDDPAEWLETLVGDAAATNDTAGVVARFIAGRPQPEG